MQSQGPLSGSPGVKGLIKRPIGFQNKYCSQKVVVTDKRTRLSGYAMFAFSSILNVIRELNDAPAIKIILDGIKVHVTLLWFSRTSYSKSLGKTNPAL